MKTLQLHGFIRPILTNALLLLGIASVWMACICAKGADGERGGNTPMLLILNLLVGVPAYLALMVHGIVFVNYRKLNHQRKRRGLRKAREAANQGALSLPPIPTRRERVAERQEELFARVRDGLDIPLRILFGMIIPGIALFVLMILRLFLGVNAFGGNPSTFHFGFRSGNQEEENSAFSSSWASYGITAAGALISILSHPAVVSPLHSHLQMPRYRCCCLGGIASTILRLTPVGSGILPVYFCLDSFVRHRQVFASSPYVARICEWSYGCLMGLALGDLVSALTVLVRARRAMSITAPEDTQPDEEEAETGGNNGWWPWGGTSSSGINEQQRKPSSSQIEAADEEDDRTPCCYKLLERFVGLCLFASLVVSAIFLSTTWHNCADDTDPETETEIDDCLNALDNRSSTMLLVVFLGVPAVALVSMPFVKSQRRN